MQTRSMSRAAPLLVAAALAAVPSFAFGGIAYVSQDRRVEAIPQDDPPPTDPTSEPTVQQAGGFEPFAGNVNAIYNWGQPGFDYGAQARITQNSTLSDTGVTADGSLFVVSDTVDMSARSVLDVTFDVTEASTFRLATDYTYTDLGSFNDRRNDARLTLRRVGADGTAGETLVDRPVDWFESDLADADGSTFFDTVDTGELDTGRYVLSFLTEATTNEPEREWQYAFDLDVTADDPGPGPTPNPIPLPPAAWAALMTMGGFGAIRKLRRRK